MATNTYPTITGTTTVLPISASTVALDGSLTATGTFSTTITGSGGVDLLTAGTNSALYTIDGDKYTVSAGSVVASRKIRNTSIATTVEAPATFGSTFTTISGVPSLNWVRGFSGNGYFQACAQNAIYYSTNGTSWTSASGSLSGYYWQCGAYGNGIFVIPAYNSSTNIFIYSTNGTSWTSGTMPSTTSWGFCSYGNGVFVMLCATAVTTAAYSTNGTSWTLTSLPSAQGITDVCYGNGVFTACCGNTVGLYSKDGINWYQSSVPALGGFGADALAYGNNVFILMAAGSSNTAYSTDGISWTQVGTATGGYWGQIAFGGGLFIAVAQGTSTTGNTTTNGLTWTTIAYPSGYYNGIMYSKGIFVGMPAGSALNSLTGSYTLPVQYGIYNGPKAIY